jgi:hypothetical protein
MFYLLQPIVRAVQPLLIPMCFVLAWSISAMIGWSLWTGVRDTIARSRQMHQIPCTNCRFFTCNYHLKCTVHPTEALTESAINCSDYAARPNPYGETQW